MWGCDAIIFGVFFTLIILRSLSLGFHQFGMSLLPLSFVILVCEIIPVLWMIIFTYNNKSVVAEKMTREKTKQQKRFESLKKIVEK